MTRVLTRGDWLKVAGVVLASAVIGLVFFLVIDGAQARRDLLQQTLDIRAAQSRRIDGLEQELARLSRSDAESQAAVATLVEQLRRMGADPIVALPVTPVGPAQPTPQAPAGRPGSPARPAEQQPATPAPAPRPSTQPQPAPQPPPSPSPRPCPVPELPVIGCPVPR